MASFTPHIGQWRTDHSGVQAHPFHVTFSLALGVQIGARGGVRILASLLPVAQRPKRDLVARRELLLREPQRSWSFVLFALALAFALGAGHALSPGHGKALVADVLAMADLPILAEPALTEIMVTAPLPDGVPACLSSAMVLVCVIGVLVESVEVTAAPVGGVPDAVAVLLTTPASTSAWVSV